MSVSPLLSTSRPLAGSLSPPPHRLPTPASNPHSSPIDVLASASNTSPTAIAQPHSTQAATPLSDATSPVSDVPVLELVLFPSLSPQTMEDFRTVEAFVRNHQARLEEQLAVDHPNVDPDLLGPAIIVSIWDRDQSILSGPNRLKLNQLLSEHTPLSEHHRGLAVIATSMRGDLILIDDEIIANTDDGIIINTLDRLLANGPISIQHRGEAIVDCIHPNVINQLLNNGIISEGHHVQAITIASRNTIFPSMHNAELNRLLTTEMIDQLFAQGPIQDASRNIIVPALAGLDHSLERLNRFLADGAISDDSFHLALKAATQQGQVQNTWRLTRDEFNPIQRLLHSLNACINQALPPRTNVFGLSAKEAAYRGEIRNAWRLSRHRYNLIQRVLFCVSAGISRILR